MLWPEVRFGIGMYLILTPLSWAQGAPALRTIYHFTGGRADGNGPGALVSDGRVLYGTTTSGGPKKSKCPGGCGTVFSLTPNLSPRGTWTEQMLFSFSGASDGLYPQGLAIDGAGVLYGANAFGGPMGHGTIFSLTPPSAPGGPWTEQVLYSYAGGVDGDGPNGVVIGSGGVLYGATLSGGYSQDGTVFSLTPPSSPGGAWTHEVLFRFTGADGSAPVGVAVSATAKGDELYGWTSNGGNYNLGIVYRLRRTAGGTWSEDMLYNSGAPGDGYGVSGIVLGAGSTIYGTTVAGGSSNQGTVFSLDPPSAPGGVWSKTVLYNFAGEPDDGANAEGGLVIGAGGVLYGTTAWGGSGPCHTVKSTTACGVVFSLTPPVSRQGAWTEVVLHSFSGGRDGKFPQAGLLLDQRGRLFGTTWSGGGTTGCTNGCGTVFVMRP